MEKCRLNGAVTRVYDVIVSGWNNGNVAAVLSIDEGRSGRIAAGWRAVDSVLCDGGNRRCWKTTPSTSLWWNRLLQLSRAGADWPQTALPGGLQSSSRWPTNAGWCVFVFFVEWIALRQRTSDAVHRAVRPAEGVAWWTLNGRKVADRTVQHSRNQQLAHCGTIGCKIAKDAGSPPRAPLAASRWTNAAESAAAIYTEWIIGWLDQCNN